MIFMGTLQVQNLRYFFFFIGLGILITLYLLRESIKYAIEVIIGILAFNTDRLINSSLLLSTTMFLLFPAFSL